MHKTPLLILAVAFLLTAPGSASADEFAYPSTAVSVDVPIVEGAVAVADQFWSARGVSLPPLTGVYELPADDLYSQAGAYSELPGNRIWIAGWVLENISSPYIRTTARATMCYLVIHERGHNAGLRHSDAGVFPIMGIPDQVGPGYWQKSIAPRCWAWAKHPFLYAARTR